MARKPETTAEETAIASWLYNAAMNFSQAIIYARRDTRALDDEEHAELSQELVDALLLYAEHYFDKSAQTPTVEQIKALPTCGNA